MHYCLLDECFLNAYMPKIILPATCCIANTTKSQSPWPLHYGVGEINNREINKQHRY